MPDPVVSPADTPNDLAVTIRRAIPTVRLGRRSRLPLGDVERDALAAVDEWLAVGERDRRQIARLTEVGKAALIVADLNGEMRSTYGRVVTHAEWSTALCNLEMVAIAARAVLADEEDARP